MNIVTRFLNFIKKCILTFLSSCRELYLDAKNIQEKDPAANNILYVILLYQGFHVLVFYRIAHFFYHTESGRILNSGKTFRENAVIYGDHFILF